MRSLMEFAEGKVKDELLVVTKGERDGTSGIHIHICGDEDCVVCGLFGRNHGKHKLKNGEERDFTDAVLPTRLIVRDAKLIKKSITDKMKENLDLEWTEVKFENNIDRITSKANPRQSERVPAGAEFEAEFVVNRLKVDGEDDGDLYIKKLIQAMRLLEDDYLGGQGTRGNGKVQFVDIKIFYKDRDAYFTQKQPQVIAEAAALKNLQF